jgi:hypothetical protein
MENSLSVIKIKKGTAAEIPIVWILIFRYISLIKKNQYATTTPDPPPAEH